MFGPKREEERRDEELHNLYSCQILLEWENRRSWMRHVAHMRDKRDAYKVLL
jgi:hypothetical protein